MSDPTAIMCVIPSRLAVGERFTVKVKVLGAVRTLQPAGQFNTPKPGLRGPYNLNVQRQIHYVDNCLPQWTGRLQVTADSGLDGPDEIAFDGNNQGVFAHDTRPIRTCDGFAWTEPGIHFLRLVDPATEVQAWSNPVRVTEIPPAERIFWGDPHWQTFFSDGIRCPEELYHFARYEGFLDFGAISDHMEAVTDRQWDYFQAVTNDANTPGEFATLIGQEWTHHNKAHGAPGHRNIYYRGDGGPITRSNDPDCDTLAKLWATLDAFGEPAVAIPHHSANVIMGVDWDQGWNARYETAVEICSVWGSSEKSEAAGNTRPIRSCNGEMDGRHVIDALRRGYRFGFMGGGDIHDGRPGHAMHAESYPPGSFTPYQQGLTAVRVPHLTREAVFDAIAERRTYAASMSRIYLDVEPTGDGASPRLTVRAASEEGLHRVVLVTGDQESQLPCRRDQRAVEGLIVDLDALPDDGFCYVRVETGKGNLAWSTPLWGDSWKS